MSFVLLPSVAVAAGVLAYFSTHSALQFARETQQSVLSSTLALVDEKVERIEQQIIEADEAVFGLVDLEDPAAVIDSWPPVAERLSPSIRALLVLDENGALLGDACRCSAEERRLFLRLFMDRVRPELDLGQEPTRVLRHHHQTHDGQSYLFSTRVERHGGRKRYLIAHHDTGFLVRVVFPEVFGAADARIRSNVVDDDDHLVFGQSRIARAGDYLVSRRFPTTLYAWRVQIAPTQAPALVSRGRERAYSEAALVALSFAVVLLGVGFLLYAAEKEARLNALRSEFVANVSHELKTPLSVVRMFSEMLMTGRVRDEGKRTQYLQIIARESERLSGLIDNVLDFSALERGKQVYEMRDGDLPDVVARAIETFRYRLEKDGVELTLAVQGALPPVRFDEQAILLAVINLLDNAVKYGEGTPVEVRVEVGRRHAYVRVRDHGPGIPVEHHRRVFERFYRVRGGGAPTRGSGIGLSLVKRIIEAHRGRAWIENAEGGGARVTLSLPFAAFAGRDAGTFSNWRGGSDGAESTADSGPATEQARRDDDAATG